MGIQAFERSWHIRKVRGRIILPIVRDQGVDSICEQCAVAGGIESVHKQRYAEIGQDFNSLVSIDDLISKAGRGECTEDILAVVKKYGVLTQEWFEEYLRRGVGAEMGDLERLEIDDYICLQPQMWESDLAELIIHVMSGGTAIGVLPITQPQAYTDATTDYYDVGEPTFRDTDDEEDYEDDEDDDDDDDLAEKGLEYEDDDGSDVVVYHAVLLCSLGRDEDRNLFWRILDSHSTNAGENGMRQIGINLIKEAYIIIKTLKVV